MIKALLHQLNCLIYVFGGWHMMLLFERLVARKFQVVVLMYHHLRDVEDAAPSLSPLADGLPVRVFERHIRMFRNWYAPISLQEFEEFVSGRGELRRDAVLVTFDDGYRDNRTLAGPFLRRCGLRGVVFVPTGYIDTSRRFWPVKLDDVLSAMTSTGWKKAAASLPGPTSAQIRSLMVGSELDGLRSRQQLRSELSEAVRGLAAEDRDSFLDHLAQFADGVEATCLPLLTWSEIRGMQEEEFDFGAHSHNHPALGRLSRNDIGREFAESRRIFQRNLGRVPRSLAYPFGDFSNDVIEEAEKAGFGLAFSTQPGLVDRDTLSTFSLPRISLWRCRRCELMLTIVAMKLTKYFPRFSVPILEWMLGKKLPKRGGHGPGSSTRSADIREPENR